ncbi:hypothetical protein [Haloplanus pelagicus]|uniref:hypothetical protein n=1 Tax=Haloplanus pelagicus TaxID=2949995 RepID=UPI00203D1EA2|nr:hypothetical protein [Haloplanus sp. HW8-1]
MDILLLRTWIRNIGNGFIDKGAKAQLTAAFPDANIVEASGYGVAAADENAMGGIDGLLGQIANRIDYSKAPQEVENVFKLPESMEFDLAVLPGCVLTTHALRKYHSTLRSISDRGIPILILGGGGTYNDPMRNYVRGQLRELDSVGLISRDGTAYEYYSDTVAYSREGIDCAFFINDWFEPPDLEKEYITAAFDKRTEPTLRSDAEVIRPHHDPFGFPFQGVIKEFLRPTGKNVELSTDILASLKSILAAHLGDGYFDDPNVFVSDLLEDYLTIYANTDRTISDRVHACVPTLVYGSEAYLYYETGRSKLFDEVMDREITDGFSTIDQEKLRRKKREQVEAIDTAVDELL